MTGPRRRPPRTGRQRRRTAVSGVRLVGPAGRRPGRLPRLRDGRAAVRHLGGRPAGRDARADPAVLRPGGPGVARPHHRRRPAVLAARHRTAPRGAEAQPGRRGQPRRYPADHRTRGAGRRAARAARRDGRPRPRCSARSCSRPGWTPPTPPPTRSPGCAGMWCRGRSPAPRWSPGGARGAAELRLAARRRPAARKGGPTARTAGPRDGERRADARFVSIVYIAETFLCPRKRFAPREHPHWSKVAALRVEGSDLRHFHG